MEKEKTKKVYIGKKLIFELLKTETVRRRIGGRNVFLLNIVYRKKRSAAEISKIINKPEDEAMYLIKITRKIFLDLISELGEFEEVKDYLLKENDSLEARIKTLVIENEALKKQKNDLMTEKGLENPKSTEIKSFDLRIEDLKIKKTEMTKKIEDLKTLDPLLNSEKISELSNEKESIEREIDFLRNEKDIAKRKIPNRSLAHQN